ncbi:hypothetical protein [Pedobacter nototheniae]|uniref:hypothetical protein n=1 Tax=Pedobacter nototheniae TaxID=2488994 RepID=UPI00103C3B3F|nr:hypothetical protein [Pedobacter nototheniae]
MGVIKIKEIEGEITDVQSLFKDGNCNLSSYIGAEAAGKKVNSYWLVSIVAIFFVLCCIIWTDLLGPNWSKVAILGAIFSACIVLFIVHSNYRSKSITGILIGSLILILTVVLGISSPQDALKKVEAITIEKFKR